VVGIFFSRNESRKCEKETLPPSSNVIYCVVMTTLAPTLLRAFSCGQGMVYRDTHFCSPRCREWYDSGNLGYAQDWLKRATVNAAMRDGCAIRCAHCQQEFDSIGLRCCSTECEQRHREHESNLRVMAEVGIEPPLKRKCECCGRGIPIWRNGRRISRATRFCSDRCSRKAKLAEGYQTPDPTFFYTQT
jgi:hypothetical protein